MNPASASEIADQLLRDLAPIDPGAADALGLEPTNVMPALAPADWERVAEHRPGFDLRAFHMHALRLGPLGLGPLREAMS